MDHIFNRVRAVASEVLEIPPERLLPTTRLGREFDIDSMQLVTLMIGLDEAFDLEIDTERFSDPDVTLAAIAESLRELLKQAGREA